MRILIVTSCTGEKAARHDRALTLADFRQGPEHVTRREQEFADLLMPAERLYTGEQHARLLRGLRAFRERRSGDGSTIDLRILSAGYGLIPHDRPLAPYECTFQGMARHELREWADRLGVPAAIRRVLAGPYDLGLVLLGDAYLRACALDDAVRLGGPTIFFCGARAAAQLPRLDLARPVVLSTAEARRFSCGLVGLKGEIAGRLLALLAGDPAALARILDPATDVLGLLERDDARAGEAGGQARPRAQVRPNPAVDQVVELPRSWWRKPHRERFRYFIPDWDDHVDPDYDFATETHSGGRGDWSNEVYAHQLYPEPSYDGLLVSRSVIEKGKKAQRTRRERFDEHGVHRYLRVPQEFPVMGDCGAFDYIDRAVPPYTTGEVLDYYTGLGFDYGVSVDHLIVAATGAQARRRYELTLHNAEEFLREHRRRGLSWEPIGAVQGWDPPSYAEAARRTAAMGYRYLGLGGLVRSRPAEILRIVEAVRGVVPGTVSLHVFGVARLGLIEAFVRLGVQSADSATYLRQAWLDPARNLLMPDGWYAALRIPEAGGSPRARKVVAEGHRTADELRRLEDACLTGLRRYAAGRGDPPEALLDRLAEYDRLVGGGRGDPSERIRRTLEGRPWERCDCAVCARWGVEVAIFRGNNRNRRRGFHNTYVFYGLMQRLVGGESIAWLRRPGSGEDWPRQLPLFAAAD